MKWKRVKYIFGNAIEVEEHLNGRFGAPGQKREKKRRPTKNLIAKRNQYNKEKRARHKLRKWYGTRDYLIDLTYRRDERPADMEEAKRHFKAFCREVRKQYQKRGYEFRWLRNIEVGTKNGWHIHVVVNRIPDSDLIIKDAWGHGKVVLQFLYEKGEFRELAAYITKTPETDPRLKEASYSSSRNLPLDEPVKQTFSRWPKKIRIPTDFYLDKESVWEGTNPFTGTPCRVYTLLRVRRE